MRVFMAAIVLAAFNSKYIHCSLGLRYLLANLNGLQTQAEMLEFDLSLRPIDAVERMLARRPRIVAMGVYLWNAELCTRVAGLIKRIRPDVKIIVGGPEVSYEIEQQPICRTADYVIAGEGEMLFPLICRMILEGKENRLGRIIQALPVQLGEVALPYDHYADEDLSQRIVYVEASRGCPFKCEFCLSSLSARVRTFELGPLFEALEKLFRRGLRHYKFVDRTFNLDPKRACAVLEFFLAHCEPGLLVHFELVPGCMPRVLRDVIQKFPAGVLQFEIGVQSLSQPVLKRVSRVQDCSAVAENIAWLRRQSGVHLHADLIAGLPGEDLGSFARGFNLLFSYGPQEIQLGVLKRLRGAAISRHDQEWSMVYSPDPPYEVLSSSSIDFQTMQRLKRFAKYWELVCNSGNFMNTAHLIWDEAPFAERSDYGRDEGSFSPGGRSNDVFGSFMHWSDWLFARVGAAHGIARARLGRLLAEYLVDCKKVNRTLVRDSLQRDLAPCKESTGLRPETEVLSARPGRSRRVKAPGMTRQLRHMDGCGAGRSK